MDLGAIIALHVAWRVPERCCTHVLAAAGAPGPAAACHRAPGARATACLCCRAAGRGRTAAGSKQMGGRQADTHPEHSSVAQQPRLWLLLEVLALQHTVISRQISSPVLYTWCSCGSSGCCSVCSTEISVAMRCTRTRQGWQRRQQRVSRLQVLQRLTADTAQLLVLLLPPHQQLPRGRRHATHASCASRTLATWRRSSWEPQSTRLTATRAPSWRLLQVASCTLRAQGSGSGVSALGRCCMRRCARLGRPRQRTCRCCPPLSGAQSWTAVGAGTPSAPGAWSPSLPPAARTAGPRAGSAGPGGRLAAPRPRQASWPEVVDWWLLLARSWHGSLGLQALLLLARSAWLRGSICGWRRLRLRGRDWRVERASGACVGAREGGIGWAQARTHLRLLQPAVPGIWHTVASKLARLRGEQQQDSKPLRRRGAGGSGRGASDEQTQRARVRARQQPPPAACMLCSAAQQ